MFEIFQKFQKPLASQSKRDAIDNLIFHTFTFLRHKSVSGVAVQHLPFYRDDLLTLSSLKFLTFYDKIANFGNSWCNQTNDFGQL